MFYENQFNGQLILFHTVVHFLRFSFLFFSDLFHQQMKIDCQEHQKILEKLKLEKCIKFLVNKNEEQYK